VKNLERVEIEKINGVDMYRLDPTKGEILIMSYDMNEIDISTVAEVFHQTANIIPDAFKDKFIAIPKGIELDITTGEALKIIIERLKALDGERD
jgi:hypothetical protein